MDRRDLLTASLGAGAWMLLERGADAAALSPTETKEEAREAHSAKVTDGSPEAPPFRPPDPPERIPVAFLISQGATVIDFCGPWEVFQDVQIGEKGQDAATRWPFQLFTVADDTEPVRVSGGLQVVPDHDFESCPTPRVVVVPALRSSRRMLRWLRSLDERTDAILSVCTGAFALAAAGLLDDRAATTHHLFLDRLARQFPRVEVESGRRWVEGSRISTAGGLTSGIDLALRTVERYFGRDVVDRTVEYLEYQSPVWAR